MTRDPLPGALPERDRLGARVSGTLAEFLATEVAGGSFLVLAAIAALLWAALGPGSYVSTWTVELPQLVTRFGLPGTPRALINEGLMTLFFFVVGLEIKRELVRGELHDRRAAAAPIAGALGGMLLPAAIYALMTGRSATSHGWGIPMATDIAFALAVLALFGRRLPSGARVFLLTLAVADDIGTLLVIAIFYSVGVRWVQLIAALLVVTALIAITRRRRMPGFVYVLAGLVLWWLTLHSGIAPTIAGVALGLLLPANASAERTEHLLHPWTGFLIVPLFALANAGLPIAATAIDDIAGSPVARALVVARVAGKVLGIALGTALAVRLLGGVLPQGVRLRHVIALGLVASVGFTVPLLVATLAFTPQSLVDDAKLGIFAATVLGFFLGGLALWITGRQPRSGPA